MPKMKTNKSIAKRVKVTARGKLMRHRPGAGHLRSRKSPKTLRHLRRTGAIVGAYIRTIKRAIGA